jgi:putative transposase
VGWSMQPRMERDLVLKALLMALWRRKPKSGVVVHSDSEYIGAGSFWWSDCLNVRHDRASGAGRPQVA